MNILQVNNSDLLGRRFNGFDLNQSLREGGDSARMLVLSKSGNDESVELISAVGSYLSKVAERVPLPVIQEALAPKATQLQRKAVFRHADIVHYHLVHNHLLAMPDFPLLTRAKPSVWTWHDPWAVTGHCVHPKDCNGWRTGCTPCPHLDEYFPLKKDCAGELWSQKRKIYRQMDADIVVSSDFMLDFVKSSPLGQCFSRVHKIPFGIRLEDFGKRTQGEARERLGIPQDHFVIAYRCEANPYKGSDYVHQALLQMPGSTDVTVLSVGRMSMPQQLKRRFHCRCYNDV